MAAAILASRETRSVKGRRQCSTTEAIEAYIRAGPSALAELKARAARKWLAECTDCTPSAKFIAWDHYFSHVVAAHKTKAKVAGADS